METEKLRELQRPLKTRYQADKEASLVTFHTSGTLGEDISCHIDTGIAQVTAGLHPAAGGDGTLACSGDMLMEALVACAGVTLNAVATNMGIQLQYTEIFAEGDMDFRGTLGVDRTVPVGLTNIRLRFDIQDDIPEEKKKKLVELTERYCVIYQTLINPPQIKVDV
ncbi:OsmC family protein [uncultured Bdellovibrio sp.]|uniref:OsmC family protein n=1 Tax=Bdellovibrio sp. HCB-162 TaxID=3394234 RepID=UPI0025E6768F|nr:OsmC family protein [uncultured Bdellovibrio sp.]